MTPPDANIETQKRRHRPLLTWMLAAAVIVIIGGFAVLWSPFGQRVSDDEASETSTE